MAFYWTAENQAELQVGPVRHHTCQKHQAILKWGSKHINRKFWALSAIGCLNCYKVRKPQTEQLHIGYRVLPDW